MRLDITRRKNVDGYGYGTATPRHARTGHGEGDPGERRRREIGAVRGETCGLLYFKVINENLFTSLREKL